MIFLHVSVTAAKSSGPGCNNSDPVSHAVAPDFPHFLLIYFKSVPQLKSSDQMKITPDVGEI